MKLKWIFGRAVGVDSCWSNHPGREKVLAQNSVNRGQSFNLSKLKIILVYWIVTYIEHRLGFAETVGVCAVKGTNRILMILFLFLRIPSLGAIEKLVLKRPLRMLWCGPIFTGKRDTKYFILHFVKSCVTISRL